MKEGTRTPRFYGLPKIHKQYSDFPPLRPICSGYNSCTVRISEFVDNYLKPIAQQSSSYVKDTTAFLNKLRNFTISPNTTANQFLVTMDVTSLYPNIDHEEGTEACYDRLRRHKIPSLLCNFLRRLIYLVLKCNTLRFGSRFFHQIKGTAMGTPMAVNFANIFMSKFEEEMLNEFQSIYGLRPALWLRFIDDIFFIWDNDEISLQSFLKFCDSYSTNKKMKSTINFTFNYSKQEVIFLDTKISFQHNVLVSQLYSKPTSAHQYLQRNSFHPLSLLKSIPKSQFIRIRRICTHLSDYWLHATKFLEHFSARGFNRVKLQQQARSVASLDRESLLCPPIDTPTNKQDRIPFVLFWHSKFNGIGKVLHDNYNKMITDHPALKEVFPYPPLLSYRKNRNLRNILVHSSIASEPRSHDRFQITEPCNHPSCLTCHSMSNTRHIINHCNKRRAPTAGGNCSTSNVGYGAECLKHKQLYVGYTNRPVHVRFNNHRSDITTHRLTCELVKHFHDQNCDFQKDLRLYILENNLPVSRSACEAREDSWIIKLDTRSPNGLNSKLNDYGNLYYSLF